MIKKLFTASILISFFASPVLAEPLANQLFGAKRTATNHKAQSIGYYSRGCFAGGMQLPETGPTWQAMRLSRNRNWGHPEAIAFAQRLSRFAAKQPGWNGLYIGDISQPRGGPMTSGHASHQLGLDLDIWMLPAKRLNLSRSERESLSSISIRTNDQKRVNGNWTRAHHNILKAAALDPKVDRILVAAAVKIKMCKDAKGNRKWLQKIRPFWKHNYHFHVRLKCPAGSPVCQTQTPVSQISKGDGCDKTLDWWVTDALIPQKPSAVPKPKKRGARQMIMADLPKQCRAVLVSK